MIKCAILFNNPSPDIHSIWSLDEIIDCLVPTFTMLRYFKALSWHSWTYVTYIFSSSVTFTTMILMDRCSIDISVHKKSFFQRRGGQKDTIMGWKPIHFGLAGMMLIFGSFNTLSVKWADTMKRWLKILFIQWRLWSLPLSLQRVSGWHHEALQPPLPTGPTSTLSF